MHTPIAFLIFNRPELTERTFAAIARVRPPVLLVVADGPRQDRPGEAERCEQARAIIERVDWDCRVFKNYADVNLGCRRRVSSGLDWVFENVEEAIILEDDCLPVPSFFPFCEALLDRYRNDERVGMISGDNFQHGRRWSDDGYYFSRYTHIWGWASWRRAWRWYDVDMKSWPQFRDRGLLASMCPDRVEQKYWTGIFNWSHGGHGAWDYAWLYACWSQGALTVLPQQNLVSNIGFGPDGTHTTSLSPSAELPAVDHLDVRPPVFVARNEPADAFAFENHFGGRQIRQWRTKLLYQCRKYGSRGKRWVMKWL